LRKWLHRIAVPTHVIWGARDRVIPPDYATEFARLIPGAAVTILEDCGHLPQIEQPDALARALGGFIRGVTP
jgi:pimeloyl-ACP methyl ester carboxylesterase